MPPVTPADHSRPILTAEDIVVIRVAWALWDDARDRGDLGAARSIMQGLEARARELGCPSVWAIANI